MLFGYLLFTLVAFYLLTQSDKLFFSYTAIKALTQSIRFLYLNSEETYRFGTS